MDIICSVTVDDLNRVGEKYLAPLFEAKDAKTSVVTDSAKVDEIAAGFKK